MFTIFLSTHNMGEANQLCDRITIFNHGRIAAIDTLENLRMKNSGLKSVEVSFKIHVSVDALSKISGVSYAEKMGEGLTEFARSESLVIISLNTLAPTLKDLFVKLIKEQEGD